MTNRDSSINSEGIFEPFSVDDAPWEDFSHGQRFASRFKRLEKFGGGTHVGVSFEELEPGKHSGPAHYHMLEEEHLYILDGSLTLRLGEQTFKLTKGSYVCFPAGQKAGHTLFNHSNATCRYLIIGEKNPHEVTIYTDSGRIQVRLAGEGYDKSQTMEYWEGEEE